MKVYLAAPWFTKEQERVYNNVVHILRNRFGHDNVFVPRELKIPNEWDLPNHVWGRRVAEHDAKEILRCDCVYAIDWGFNSDAGTAWEVGFAAGHGKRITTIVPNGVDIVSCMMASSAYLMITEEFKVINRANIQWK